MSKRSTIKPEFVVCVDNDGYPAALEKNKIYRLIPDKKAAIDGDIRVVDESGEDYLFPASRFAPIKVSSKLEDVLLRSS